MRGACGAHEPLASPKIASLAVAGPAPEPGDGAAPEWPCARVMRSTPAATVSTVVADPADLARLGALVRLLRVERDMSVSELARRSMCARSTVQRLEAGKLRLAAEPAGLHGVGPGPGSFELIRVGTGHRGGRQGRARRGRQLGPAPGPAYMDKSRALRDQAGGAIGLGWGDRRVVYRIS